MRNILLIIVLCTLNIVSFAQAEKRYVRMGNKHYDKENFTEAEVNYLRALTIDSTSYSAAFNLGATLYKQNRHEDAERVIAKVASDSASANYGSASFNLANTYLKQRKLEQAIEAYKGALRMHPTDTLAKKNMAYAQQLLEDKKKEDQDKKDNKEDKDKEDNKEDQNKNDQDNQDKKDQDKKDQNQDQNQNQQPQNKDGQMSKEEAEQILEAMQKNEDNTQEKVNEKKAVGIKGSSAKNW